MSNYFYEFDEKEQTIAHLLQTLETADKLKKGDNIHHREDPEYQWTQITPHTEPINTSVQVPYTVSTGKTHMTHYRDEAYTINP